MVLARDTTSPSLDDVRWMAVSTRDPRAEGSFLYGVRTTGVYCRPTCHSRLPRRENVSYYASPAEAERAGFRSDGTVAALVADALARLAPRAI